MLVTTKKRRQNKITLSLLANESFNILMTLAYLSDEPEIIKESSIELVERSKKIYNQFIKRVKRK